ncbi:MAG TPA: c-type cytochrome [Kofleriaceae bacterium]|nr:c-type cytochrome [Kofleriaceae bacterium]
MFVKNVVGVLVAMAIITTLALSWGRPSNHPQPKYKPLPTISKAMPPEEVGEIAFQKMGCATCHTIDGSTRIGPTFLHDFGSRITLDTGEMIVVDDAYLRESIEQPRAKSRPGYPPAMPAEYATLLTDLEKEGLVAYIKTLR